MLEGVHNNEINQVAWHTNPNCYLDTTQKFTGNVTVRVIQLASRILDHMIDSPQYYIHSNYPRLVQMGITMIIATQM